MSTNSVKGAAIVTGAAQGIGKAIAIRLAKDGYDVALNDVPGKEDLLRTVADEITSEGRKSTIIIADVTNEKSVVEMVKNTVSELGILRVMVANAGISLTTGKELIDTPLEDFDKVLKVNLIGVFLCYREAARQMVQQGTWGRIIGASSLNGKRAAEMINHGITVNAYAPGFIDTPMGKPSSGLRTIHLTDERFSARRALSPPEDANLNEEEKTQKMVERASASTGLAVNMGTPADVANLVSYLASEESKFMTGEYSFTFAKRKTDKFVGQTLSVNGGVFFG